MKRYYPVFLDVEGKTCLIVGGGDVAARKAKSLADAGACVRIVSPEFCGRLQRMADRGKVSLERKRFAASDVDDAFLAIACTDDRKVNEKVRAAARRRGMLTNVVDSAELCNFILPAVVSRGPLKIAVSTSGVSPALARRIRKDLEKRYPRGYGDFLELMEKSRSRIIEQVPASRPRKRIFEALTAQRFLGRLLRKGKREGENLFREKLEQLLSKARSGHV
jgi:precorrin-2 dehydrogenase/sirohydrochlorin ferrochelatase